MRRRFKRTRNKNSIWRSYSDMMSGLLLLFILIMTVYLMQAQKNYTEKLAEQAKQIKTQNELEESQKKIEEQQSALLSQESELENQASELAKQKTDIEEKESELSEQKMTLAEQAKMLEELQTALESQESELTQKESEVDSANATITQKESEIQEAYTLLNEKESELNQSQSELEKNQAELEKANEEMLDGYIKLESSKEQLEEANTLMSEQQAKIDQIIGIKAELVDELYMEFQNADVQVQIDKETGAMLLDSSVLYEFGKSELTDGGKEILDDVLPVYCYVLLSDEHIENIGEIIVDGYADSVGEYKNNLKLSQERAYAVATYMLDEIAPTLTSHQLEVLQSKLTVNGKSSSNPIINEQGEEDSDASRRVEIKFRLKDEEMIAELQQLIGKSQEAAKVVLEPELETEASGETESVTEETESAKESELITEVTDSITIP